MILADSTPVRLDADQMAVIQQCADDLAALKGSLVIDSHTQGQLVVGGFMIIGAFLAVMLPVIIIKRANRSIGGYDE